MPLNLQLLGYFFGNISIKFHRMNVDNDILYFHLKIKLHNMHTPNIETTKTEQQVSGNFCFFVFETPVDKLHMIMWSTGDNRPGLEGQSATSDFAWVLPFLKTLLQNTWFLVLLCLIKRVLWAKGNNNIKFNLFGSGVQTLRYFPWSVIPSAWQKRQVSHTCGCHTLPKEVHKDT